MFSWQDFCVSCLVLRGPAQSTCTWTCHVTRAISRENLQEKRCVPEVILCEPAQSKCTWQCMAMHMMSQEPFYAEKLQVKCRMPRRRHPFCASLRSRNAHGSRIMLCGKNQGKCRTLRPRYPFCASPRIRHAHGSKDVKSIQKQFYAENFKGKC